MSDQPQQLSFDEACKTIFSAWYDGTDLTAGDRVATPKDAAARAVVAALNAADGAKGTIRILVQTPEQKRLTRNFLDAFLLDQAQLKPMVRKMTPELVTLHGGISIAVDLNEARLTKSLVTIVLDATVGDWIAFRWLHPERRPGGPASHHDCVEADFDRERELVLDEMVAAGTIKPNQRHRVFFAHWKIHDPNKPVSQGTLVGPANDPGPEPGPPVEPKGPSIEEQQAALEAQQAAAAARRATEERYAKAVEQRQREEAQEKIDDHFRRYRQRGV